MTGVDAGGSICPGGYVLLPDAKVTQAISARAVALLTQWRAGNFPVGSTNSEEATSGLQLDYRFEWHPPDFQNPVKHTGVTVYYCAGGGTGGSATPAPLAPSSPAPSPSESSAGASPSPPTSSDAAPAGAAPGAAQGADAANGAGACVAPDGSVKFSLEGLLETLVEDIKKVL